MTIAYHFIIVVKLLSLIALLLVDIKSLSILLSPVQDLLVLMPRWKINGAGSLSRLKMEAMDDSASPVLPEFVKIAV